MSHQSGQRPDQVPQASIPTLLDQAVVHHQAGRLAEAERLYVQILNIDANNADCYHLLGLISFHVGNRDSALTLISKAIELNGTIPTYHYSLGNVLISSGRHEEAAASYQRALALNPDHALAHNNLGVYLLTQGKNDEALSHFNATIALQPEFPDVYNNMGKAFMNKGLFQEAAASFRHAIERNPDYAEAHNNLGTALRSLTDIDVAQNDSTIDLEARDNEALEHYQKAIALKPDLAEAHYNAGILYKETGLFEKAKNCFERAIALNPGYADAAWNLSLVLLTLGDYRNGWRQYEWRWRRKGMPSHPFAHIPLWDGSSFTDKTLLLHCEQGFGDNLHFIRYAPMVKDRGGRVILACYKPLLRLFESVPGIDEIFSIEDILSLPNTNLSRQSLAASTVCPPPLGEGLGAGYVKSLCVLQAPLLSLPMIFGTTLETIPANVPYLSPPADQVEIWAERLCPYDGLKVGLVWTGNASTTIAGARAIYRRRSLRLEQFAPLAGIGGITWFSLQKDDPDGQAKNPPPGMELVDLMSHVADFADTAAFIANLDLVIAIDTSVSHLAGGLGKPVWVLSPFDGCWRYLLERNDTPWYPTMRIFRQPVSREWGMVVEMVREKLLAQTHAR